MTESQQPSSVCNTCRSPKALLECGLCHISICKKCAEVLPKDFFSFWKVVPEVLNHTTFCGSCFDQHVHEAKQNYLKLKDQAENIALFYKKERNVPVERQSKSELTVKNCEDRNEALLRLAFFAAEQKFNAVVHIELIPEKTKINGYQKTMWHASGYPAHLKIMDL